MSVDSLNQICLGHVLLILVGIYYVPVAVLKLTNAPRENALSSGSVEECFRSLGISLGRVAAPFHVRPCLAAPLMIRPWVLDFLRLIQLLKGVEGVRLQRCEAIQSLLFRPGNASCIPRIADVAFLPRLRGRRIHFARGAREHD